MSSKKPSEEKSLDGEKVIKYSDIKSYNPFKHVTTEGPIDIQKLFGNENNYYKDYSREELIEVIKHKDNLSYNARKILLEAWTAIDANTIRLARSEGGKAGAETKRKKTEKMHKAIANKAKSLLDSGRDRKDIVGILTNLPNAYSEQHIRRILKKHGL